PCERTLTTRRITRSAPLQRHAHIAWHSPREVNDLESQFVSTRLQMLFPKSKQLERKPRERLFPTRLLLVDGAAAVREKLVWKTTNLNLGPAVVHRALDDSGSALDPFFVGNARRFDKTIQQRLLLGFGLRAPAHFLGGFLCLDGRDFLHAVLCRGQELIDLRGHGNPPTTIRL